MLYLGLPYGITDTMRRMQ